MPKSKKKYGGICTSCEEDDACTYPRNEKKPVIHCEEFKNPEPKPTRKCPQPPCSSKEPDNNFKGLCKNCENREDCKLPKPEGGIWHCQEYR